MIDDGINYTGGVVVTFLLVVGRSRIIKIIIRPSCTKLAKLFF